MDIVGFQCSELQVGLIATVISARLCRTFLKHGSLARDLGAIVACAVAALSLYALVATLAALWMWSSGRSTITPFAETWIRSIPAWAFPACLLYNWLSAPWVEPRGLIDRLRRRVALRRIFHRAAELDRKIASGKRAEL